MKIASHPRLMVSERELARLAEPVSGPLLRKAARRVAADADEFAKTTKLSYDPGLHNALLNRAREVQVRVITLLVRWRQTGLEKFRRAALREVWAMGAWTYWSSARQGEKNPDPCSDFDLSYGENSATLAFAYDWLFASLTEPEKERFRDLALRWVFRPFLHRIGTRKLAWWRGQPDSNWNTVCAGGAGLLALALLDEVPEAARVLRQVERSIAPYLKRLDELEGGWIEGIGYWNYGHRYAFWYLFSHERTTGRRHPLLTGEGVRRTLDFPLEFCPHGQPCSFGDVNLWSPLPFLYPAALRLQRIDLVRQLDRLFAEGNARAAELWPNAAELLLYHPRRIPQGPERPPRTARWYPGLEWGFLADRFPDPRFYLSIRAGTAGWLTSHSQLDLLSFFCVVGHERLLAAPGINGGKEYLDTTFGARRYELFEASPASKNTLLINGVGIANPATVAAESSAGAGWNAVRLDATSAMTSKGGQHQVLLCARLFLMIGGDCALILDRIELASPGRVEARFHSPFPVRVGKGRAVIQGCRERLQLLFASSVPAGLHWAVDALTTPGPRFEMVRWCTDERTHHSMALASLLVPGRTPAGLQTLASPLGLTVKIRLGRQRHTLRIAQDLKRISRSP